MSWLDDIPGVKDILDSANNVLTRRSKLKFSGSLVSAADNAAAGRTEVTIADALGLFATVANDAALAALSPAAADVGKFVYQTDRRELWQLAAVDPSVVWLPSGRLGFSGNRTVTGTSDTFALTDVGTKVYYNNASAITATVPPNGTSGGEVPFLANDVITGVVIGAGQVTLTPGTDVTLVYPNGKSLVTNGASGRVAVFSLSPRPGALDTWDVYGDLA